MKVFISHASKDKWAARRIAADIQTLGLEVFLDEKDIRTGESIDTAIRAHLTDSDHFLLLLSPASVKSEWVLLELGGALALGKTVVPVLLYVGANELPQAVNLRLARDINDVERYYDELRALVGIPARSAPKPRAPSVRRHTKRPRKATISWKPAVGATIKIVTKEPTEIYRENSSNSWEDPMDRYLGRTATITNMDADGDFNIDIDDGDWWWSREWVAPIEPA